MKNTEKVVLDFEKWVNENCYMNGGRLKVYGKLRADAGQYYLEQLNKLSNEKH